jgi:hypothetical protein
MSSPTSVENIDALIRKGYGRLADYEARRSFHAARGESWEAMKAMAEATSERDNLARLLAAKQAITLADDNSRAVGAGRSFFIGSGS